MESRIHSFVKEWILLIYVVRKYNKDMKKLLLLIFALPLLATAQEKLSVVTLKNGTELTGVIKAIDPMDALTISIAGIETQIKMSDIAKVGEATPIVQSVPVQPAEQLANGKLAVTDMEPYEDFIEIKIGDSTIKMILVRGGEMNMGFDGSGSLDMKSEPVHRVAVTSFYISEEFVTSQFAESFSGKKQSRKYYMTGWKNANAIVSAIAQLSGLPFRLPTEAEWEYAACSKQQSIIFSKCNDEEYCSDYYGQFSSMDFEVDPTGPKDGRRHITRYFGESNQKFDRSQSTLASYFRLVIKAKDVSKK